MIDVWPQVTAAFVTGLLGSAHCLGMCGGIAGTLAVSTDGVGEKSALERAVYLLLYNGGRISSYVLADAVILVSGGVLRGAGDTRWLMVASVILHWAMLVAQYFIIQVFKLSPKVSWIAFVIMILAIAVVYAWRLKAGRWRDPEVLERVMQE